MTSGTPQNFAAPELLAALNDLRAKQGTTAAEVRTLLERTGKVLQPVPSSGVGGRAVTGDSEEIGKANNALREQIALRERNIKLAQEQVRQDALSGRFAGAQPYRPAVAGAQGGFVLAGQGSGAPAPAAAGAARSAAAVAPAALAAEGNALANVRAQHLAYQNATRSSSVLTGEFIQRLLTGKASLSEFSSQLSTAAGKYAGFTAAAAGVGVAVGVFAEIYKGAKDSASGVQQLSRTIANVDTGKASKQINDLATGTNVSLKEAGDAVFQFSRTFHQQDEAVAAARFGLQAYGLDQVQLSDSVRLATVLNQQYGLSVKDIKGEFDVLGEGQQQLNSRLSVTIPFLNTVAGALHNVGVSANEAAQIGIVAAKLSGAPGPQLGTAFARSAATFAQKPKAQAIFTELGLPGEQAASNYGALFKKAILFSATASETDRQKLAEAFGGPQLGARIFTRIFTPKAAGLYAQVEKINPQSAQGILDKENEVRLKQVDEVLKSIGIAIQVLGANLVKAHVLDIFGLVLVALKETLVTANRLASIFNSIPDPFRGIAGNLLSVTLLLKGLQKIGVIPALTTGTGGRFFGVGKDPSVETRGAAVAQQDARLADLTAARGGTLGQQVQLADQAATDRRQAQITANEDRKKALIARAEQSEAEIVGAQERQLVLEQQIAETTSLRAGILAKTIPAEEAIIAEQVKLNALQAEQLAVTEAGALGGAASGGLLARLKGGLGKAFGAGLIADIATQGIGDTIGGKTGRTIAGGANYIAAGAAIGSLVPGIGTVAGAGLGAFGAFAKPASEGLGRFVYGGADPNADRPGSGRARAQDGLFQALEAKTNQALRGQLDPKQVEELHASLQRLTKDPNYKDLAVNLTQLDDKLAKLAKTSKTISFDDFKTGTQKAQQATDRAKTDNSVAGQREDYGKAVLALQRIRLSADDKNKRGITQAQIDSAIRDKKNEELGAIGGTIDTNTALANAQAPGNRLTALKRTLSGDTEKLKLAAKLFGKSSAEYKQALTKALIDQQSQLGVASSEIDANTTLANARNPGDKLGQLRRTLAGDTLKTALALKLFGKNSSEYKLAVAKGLTDQQSELQVDSAIIDANTALANARTQNKGAQLRNTLSADNQKLAVALRLFGSNSTEYKTALASSLQQQQQISQQAISDIASRNALATSRIGGTGPRADIARQRSALNGIKQELAAARSSGADPGVIRGLQTQLNDGNRALASSIDSEAKAFRNAALAIREANTLDPVKQAQLRLQAAVGDLQGLSGSQRQAQLAQVAQQRRALEQAGITEDLSQLNYEAHIHQISDSGLIAGLQDILSKKKLSNDQRRQIQSQIYDLQHQTQTSQTSGNLNLNVGSIKLPTLYEIRRSLAGGPPATRSATVINNNPTINIQVNSGGDIAQVASAIDKTLGTTARAGARSLGII
ncbi:MAG: hypothetical protein NVS3B1_07770 [Marmoricola sp.]